MLKCSALLLCLLPGLLFAPTASAAPTTSVSVPITFERNDGQAPPRFRYLSRHRGVQALFADREIDFLVAAGQDSQRIVHMRFEGSAQSTSPLGQEPLPGYDNYFQGASPKEWKTRIPTFGEISYPNLYPGIDLLFHPDPRSLHLEHDFVVAPGGDPRQILFRLSGADNVSLTPDGDLVATVADTRLLFHAPAAWQPTAVGRKPVHAKFFLSKGGTVGFTLGRYNRSAALTIDPVLAFATYLDGTATDTIGAVTTDPSGNIYLTGTTTSTDFPTAKAEQSAIAGSNDAFIAKFDPTGHTLVYSTYIGGSNSDSGTSIAVDASGNVAIGGISTSLDFPAAGKLSTSITTYTTTYNFIASLTADGSTLRYSGFIGDTPGYYEGYVPRLNFVKFDSEGNVYLAGITQDDYPYTTGAYGGPPAIYPADGTPFVAKIEADGTIAYAATIPESPPQSAGTYGISIGGIAVDNTDSLIVAGTSGNYLPVTSGVLSSTFPNSAGGLAGFVLKLNPAGSALVFSTYIPGTDAINGIAEDSKNDLYVVGQTAETTLPTGANAYQPSFGEPEACDCEDAYILHLSADGTTALGATYFNGATAPGNISGPRTTFFDISIDPSGNVAVGGVTGASNLPLVNPLGATFTELGLASIGSTMFVARFSGDLSTLQFGTFLNPPDYAAGYSGLTTDSQGHILATGYTLSRLFPTTSGAFQATPPSPPNANTLPNYQFLASIDPSTAAPSMCFDSTALSFGSVLVGTEADATLHITNCGNASLTLTALTSSSPLVTTTHNCTGITPGNTCQVQLTYSPAALVTTTGTLSIAANTAISPQQVSFTGTGGEPSVDLPASIPFSSLLVGETGAEATLGISNSGDAPFILTSASVTGDYQIVTNGCSTPVAPQGSCSIVMNFSPTAAGTRSGTLVLNDDLSTATQAIALTGQGLMSAPVPVITQIPAIASIASGNGDVLVYGNGFMPNSTVEWNGSSRPTSYEGSGFLIGTLTAADLSQVGEASVTVSTPAPGGGTSVAATATIYGRLMNIEVLNEVYDSATQLLYASVSTTSGTYANCLVAIDPVTMQVVSTLLSGNQPDALALSDDGSLLYVGLDGAQSVAQLSVPAGTTNFTVKIPSGGDSFLAQNGMMASALAVMPGYPHTWLVGLCYENTIPCGAGVAVFDDATERSTQASGIANSFTFASDPGMVYSTVFNQSPPNIYSYAISSSGISLTNTSSFSAGVGGGSLASDGNLIYVANGEVIDPLTLQQLFGYSEGGTAFALDNTTRRLFFAGYNYYPLTLLSAVDSGTQALIGTIQIQQAGEVQGVQRFGTKGLVIQSQDMLLFFETSLATVAAPSQVVSISPASLTFGNQEQGTTSSAQTVTLTNGTANLITVNSATASGDFAATTGCGSNLAAGSSCTISVTFTPTVGGSRTGDLTVNTSGNPAILSLPLNGTGTALTYIATISPTSLAFASRTIGTTSATQTVTLTNTGTGALTLGNIIAYGDFAQTNQCPQSLAAGASCSLSVTFTPSFSGTRTGSLNIGANTTSGSLTVSLSGTGAAAETYAATASPASLTFTPQVVGVTSSRQQVTITNTGAAPLTIAGIRATGDFAESNACGSTLAAAANCFIAVTFTPTATGIRSGTLTVSDNATAGPQAISLSGTGTMTTPLTYAASVSPVALTFQTQPEGTTSSAQAVRLANTGTGFLTISGIAVIGDYGETNTCGSGLAAGSNCSIAVTFAPTAGGDRTGALTISDNAASNPQTVNLDGNGALPLVMSPATSGGNSATVPAGSTATYNLTLTTASFSGAVSLSCTGAPANASCSVNPVSPTVSAGNPSPITVTVTTNGQASATLVRRSAIRLCGIGLLALACIPLFFLRRRVYRLGFLALVLSLISFGAVGCGGGGGSVAGGGSTSTPPANQETVPGTYTLTVTATANGLNTSEQLTLIVQ